MYYVIDKVTSHLSFFPSAYDVSAYMLGRVTRNYIIIKSPSYNEPLDKMLVDIPSDVFKLEKQLEAL